MKFDSPEFAYGAIGTGVFLIVIIALLTVLLIRCNGNGQVDFNDEPVTYYYDYPKERKWPWNRRTVSTIPERPASSESVPTSNLVSGRYKNVYNTVPDKYEFMNKRTARKYHSAGLGLVKPAGPPHRYTKPTEQLKDANKQMIQNFQLFSRRDRVLDPENKDISYTFDRDAPNYSRRNVRY